MINILLAYHMARIYRANTDAAMLHAARVVRAQTHNLTEYKMLGLFINSTPTERGIMVESLA